MRLLNCSTILAVLLATSALAQTAAADSADLSRGTNLPPSAAAWAEGSTSMVHNPAGLSHSGLFEATFAHERSNARGLDADGLYLSGGPGGMIGMGLSFDWLRPFGDPANARARTSWGLPSTNALRSSQWSCRRTPPLENSSSADVKGGAPVISRWGRLATR